MTASGSSTAFSSAWKGEEGDDREDGDGRRSSWTVTVTVVAEGGGAGAGDGVRGEEETSVWWWCWITGSDMASFPAVSDLVAIEVVVVVLIAGEMPNFPSSASTTQSLDSLSMAVWWEGL